MTAVNKLAYTMKSLGDATSRNLDFSYCEHVPVSYGEETITESNLLELKRRHSDVVCLRTFTKHRESELGADWEWCIRGHVRTLAMRIQAKRVQRDDVLKIGYKVRRFDKQQLDLLIEMAKKENFRPMYCIYCTESQRKIWKKVREFETGCLLVDAKQLSEKTNRLGCVEHSCWPWHLFFATDRRCIDDYLLQIKNAAQKADIKCPAPLVWDGPTICDLNQETKSDFNRVGVWDTREFEELILTTDRRPVSPMDFTAELEPAFGVKGQVIIDVRSLD